MMKSLLISKNMISNCRKETVYAKRLIKSLAVSAVILVAGLGSAWGQVSSYSFTALSGTFSQTSSQTQIHGKSVDDAISSAINIGFTFNFDGTDYTQFKASTNGWITFNTSITSSYNVNSLSSPSMRPIIAPLWDDLECSNANGGKYVNYVLSGSSPNRVLTVEWYQHRWNFSSANDVISFQVKLYETSNVIEFIYNQGAATVNSGSASIGITGVSSGFLSIGSTDTAPSSSSSAETTSLNTKPINGQIYRFAPPPTITTSSSSLTAFSACPNTASSQQSFTVSGSNLTANIVVTPPTGFEISQTSGSNFGTSAINLAPSSGSVGSTTIYVRMASQAGSPSNGNIVCSSTGATNKNVAVSGTVANTAATATTGANSSITGTSATLAGSYVANCQTITAYGIEYSTTNGFANGAGTQVSSTNQSSGSFTSSVSGLSPSTTYYYKAYATNSSGSTVYGSQSSFTTTCATASIPWNEGFEGISIPALPSCWLEENGDYVTTNNSNSTYDANARTGSNFLRESWSATNEYIWTPGFSLTAGTSYDFSFYWAGDGYSSWVGDVFRNTTQSSIGATQIGSSFISNGTLASSTYSQCTRSFTPATSGTYYFAIRVNESTGSPWYLSFDDFSLTLTPACNSTPTNLNASNLTATTATVGWDAPSPAPSNGYEYAVTTSTTPPASGTATSNTSVAVTGLSASTTYYLHVRSFCGGSDYSNWLTSTAFTTPCVAISTFPWTETFSDNSTTRSCWTVRDGNADGDFWGFSTSYPFDAGGSHASLYTDFNSTNQDYLITPQINLGSTGRQLKFQIRHYSNSEPDNIRVKLSTTGSDIANFTTSLLTLSTTQITTNYSEYTINLSAYSGNVYIAFAREDAPADGWYVYIDEVKIVTLPTSVPSCATYLSPTNGESVVPASGSVPVSWNAVTDAVSYDVYKNGSFVANTNSTSYSLTGNTVGNSYTWYVVPKNSVGDASGCSSGAYSFTCISTPSNDDPCGAIALSISNTLTYATYSNAGATATSGPPAPGCASFSTADVWFSVTVPASGIISFDSQTGTITDGGMAIYSGTCSSLTLVQCNDDSSPNGLMPYISLTGRTPGETLWIRMWEYGGDVTGTFGLCVRSQAADLTSATLNQNNVCPGTSVTLTANGVDGTAYWFTTCGTSGELGTGGTLNVSPSTTTTYYARNYRYGNFSTNCASVTVTVTQPSTTISVVNGVSIANGDYLWNGNTSNDGSVASNWYVFNGTNYTVATSAPTTQNVYIVSNTTATNCVSANSNPPSNPAAGTFAASNVYIGSGTTLTQANGSTFNVTGNFINNGTFTPGTGTVNFTGTAATQTISGTGALNFSNVTINKLAGAVSLSNDISVSGALTFENGNLNLNGKTLNYSGGYNITTNNGGILGSITSSKLNFTSSSQITGALFQSDIYDLTVADGVNVSSDGNYTVLNSLAIGTGATYSMADAFPVVFKGNIINNGTINGGSSGNGSFVFDNTGDQTISGQPISVASLQVNKNSGNVNITAPVTVTGTLTMTKGNIVNSALITIGESSSSPGSISYAGGTITGALRRYFANSTGTNYYFPIGNSAHTRGVTVNMSQNPGIDEYITAEYKSGTPQVNGSTLGAGLPLTTSDGQLVQNYDEEGYWQIDPKQYDSGIDNATYTISLQMNNISGVNDYTKTRIIKADGPSHVAWSALTHVSAVGSNTNYTLSGSGSGFSWFNGGGDNNNNPLPVELVSFTGACEEGIINLTWQTASEFNSSHFDVEKSRDGENWQLLSTIPSAGTSNELITYQSSDQNGKEGNNYFRLRQVDNDGSEKLYDPINVSCSEVATGYFSSFPNPSGTSFQVIVNNKELVGTCALNIVDATGKLIEQREIEMKDGINMFVVSQEMTPGIYFLNISNGSKSTPVLRHAIK